jgi:hypothetical protein
VAEVVMELQAVDQVELAEEAPALHMLVQVVQVLQTPAAGVEELAMLQVATVVQEL